MFFLGFFLGAAAAVWFILKDGGEHLIRTGGRLQAAVRAFRDGSDREERFGA
jgi:hypothetical protein